MVSVQGAVFTKQKKYLRANARQPLVDYHNIIGNVECGSCILPLYFQYAFDCAFQFFKTVGLDNIEVRSKAEARFNMAFST